MEKFLVKQYNYFSRDDKTKLGGLGDTNYLFL